MISINLRKQRRTFGIREGRNHQSLPNGEDFFWLHRKGSRKSSEGHLLPCPVHSVDEGGVHHQLKPVFSRVPCILLPSNSNLEGDWMLEFCLVCGKGDGAIYLFGLFKVGIIIYRASCSSQPLKSVSRFTRQEAESKGSHGIFLLFFLKKIASKNIGKDDSDQNTNVDRLDVHFVVGRGEKKFAFLRRNSLVGATPPHLHLYTRTPLNSMTSLSVFLLCNGCELSSK